MSTLSALPRRYWYPMGGAVLAVTLPIGLLGFRAAHAGSTDPNWLRFELSGSWDTYVFVAASAMLLFTALGRMFGRTVDALRAESTTDPLTHLCNRRGLELRLDEELADAARRGEPVSVLIVDVDRLKEINDAHGHEAGDRALWLVAETLRRTCRRRDLAARVGGDEFCVLAPWTTGREAMVLAERINKSVSEWGATVSIGVGATDDRKPEQRELLAKADAALYVAKAKGRNRAVLAPAEKQ